MHHWNRPLAITFVLLHLAAACGSSNSSPRARALQRGTPNASPIPAALRVALLRAHQTAAGHDFVSGSTGALESRAGAGDANALVRATDSGVRLYRPQSASAGPFDFGVETRSVGRGDAAGSQRVLDRRGEGQELVLTRDDAVEERYLAGPLGLEHSYVLHVRPAGSGPVIVDVAFPGLVPELSAGALDRVVLEDDTGHVQAGYRDLVALDAAGRSLTARMEVRGESVALVVDDSSATYPITIDPLVWTLQTELTAGDRAAGDLFGESVAVSGTLAVVGAPSHTVSGHAQAGAAYVWVQSGSTWSQQQELTASDAAKGDGFGQSVAVSGTIVVVGAPYHTVGGHSEAGAAYVFVQSGTTWSQQQELTAGDAAASDAFGNSVAVSGTTAVVGAPFHEANGHSESGAAYVFTQAGTTWSQQQELTAGDGATADLFGFSVAVSGSIALVGAYQHTVGTTVSAGAAYVWVQSGTTWSTQQELTASDGAISDFFGYSVSVSGTTAIVGALQHNVGTFVSAGAAYVWTQSGTTWTQQAELTASDGAADDLFGYSVAVSAGTVIVGALQHEVGTNAQAGSAYAFTRSGTTWTQQQELTASDGAAEDLFGSSVAASGDLVIVGAPQHEVGALAQAGAAYVLGGAFNGTTNCYINGTLYAAGAVNPANACQVCTPTSSTSAWSTASNGTSCGTGEVCSAGACVADCFIGGVLFPAGTVNPANACQVCTPASSTTTWSNEPNGTSCAAGEVCSSGSCASDCFIGGVLIPAGTVNPANTCQVCTPATSTTTWSNEPNGMTCGPGMVCSGGTCFTVPPTVALTSPSNGADVSGTVTVSATASPPAGTTLSTLAISIDGTPVQSGASSPESYSWSTLGLANGSTHTLIATATDANGGTASSTVTVTIENTPTVAVTAPTDGATVSGTVIVSATASAPVGTTLSLVAILIDGSEVSSGASSPQSYNWNTTGLGNGSTHVITASATDADGTNATSSTVTVTVVNSAPEDAGSADSGASDAGPNDAGSVASDGGSGDAGASDAGHVSEDGGSSDAGTGETDAGPTDSGSPAQSNDSGSESGDGGAEVGVKSGCGCGAGSADPASLLAFGLAGLGVSVQRRRRLRRRA
jgi:MYXO-CTERM domain-containing protein